MSGPSRIAALEAENEELRAQVRDLKQELGRGFPMPRSIRLTPSEERLLAALYCQPIVSRAAAVNALYFDDPEGGPEGLKVIDVYLCRLRQRVQPFAIEILTNHGRGWFLPPASKAIIKHLLERDYAWTPYAFNAERTADLIREAVRT